MTTRDLAGGHAEAAHRSSAMLHLANSPSTSRAAQAAARPREGANNRQRRSQLLREPVYARFVVYVRVENAMPNEKVGQLAARFRDRVLGFHRIETINL